jgi:ferric-dicitrate binding protein FerR (iron transport regulator)
MRAWPAEVRRYVALSLLILAPALAVTHVQGAFSLYPLGD